MHFALCGPKLQVRRLIMTTTISQKLIGYRVKAAREAMSWNQAQLTDALGLNDRQSISDIENGKRALKPDELVKLTEILDRDIEFFIDPFSVVGEAQFSWRAPNELSEKNLDGFEFKVGQWIGLLRWLRESEESRYINPLKYTLRLNAKSSFEDAIERAENLVKTLELGIIPAEQLIEKIEKDLDIPVLFVDTIETPEGHAISGATCHLQDMGAILINRNESEARRFYDLAHELFHALTWDAMKPDHRESNSLEERVGNKRIEQLADNFAAALLMPKNSLEQLIDRNQINDIDYLTAIAAQLRVSPEALAYRLYNLKWVDIEIKNKLKQKHHRMVTATLKRFSTTFMDMLYRKIDSGRLSARKAAKTLSMNLSQLSDLFIEHSLPVPFEM